ncbi:Protein of unknown function [Lentzea albidocapillata subsp. violacea]|uniref:Inner membrane protein YgaP-like transmembrane domain-containing protein n=1 Tax=Lentzea albidocapillata subsp. violacea TaxID=128104 RepID=A0A1H0A124_9PSEU|nr:YgaP-like transmembrane domain [Lentzea albidocapillata]SDN27258.1 Protein of unknown function [Lentzea albidocapillata subsp. violacea]
MGLVRFLGSQAGRALRVVLGLVMITVGTLAGGGWLVLAAAGLLPVAAGVFDFCLIGPLLRLPVKGRQLRARLAARA